MLVMGGFVVVLLIVLFYLVFGGKTSPTQTQLVDADALQNVLLSLAQNTGSSVTDQNTMNLNEELVLTLTSDNQNLAGEIQKVYGVKSVSNAEVNAVTNPDAAGLISNAQSDSTLNQTYSSVVTKYLQSLYDYLHAAQSTAQGAGLKSAITHQENDTVLLYDAFSSNHPSD